MKILGLLLITIVTLLAERAGPYAGASYGLGYYNSDGRLERVSNDNAHGAMCATLGAYINENFSVELDYTQYKVFDGRYATQKVHEDFAAIGVCVVPHYPFDEKWDLFGRFGAGQINWNESGERANESNAGLYLLGFGMGYRAFESVMFKSGYDMTFFSMKDTHRDATYDMRLDYFYVGFEVMF